MLKFGRQIPTLNGNYIVRGLGKTDVAAAVLEDVVFDSDAMLRLDWAIDLVISNRFLLFLLNCLPINEEINQHSRRLSSCIWIK